MIIITATLLDALNQKFGISATKTHVLSAVHLPQLFLAMQYHTGTRFEDTPCKNYYQYVFRTDIKLEGEIPLACVPFIYARTAIRFSLLISPFLLCVFMALQSTT